ncbi:hypothetical protein KFE25_007434 [Diacronema lutheri]|uniref:Uncharacterized protein n=1 Tax=Diacronema lutheri TaxID=2081491 RepID=A0A8J5XTZ2_DIALT|nr:hypothetical protein KFE25_007434 [Diacronema lutheri]
MGNWFSSRARDVRDVAKQEITDALIKSKLIDIKAHKKQRDEVIAMRMAVGRDQLHFSLGFYATMCVANVFRVVRYRRFELLPINHIPFIAGPIIFLYNVDACYGNKMERLNIEKETICRTEQHWFNRPIVLPISMEHDYRSLMRETNERLALLGCPPEPDWAVFSDHISDEDLWRSASPLSRVLHQQLRRRESAIIAAPEEADGIAADLGDLDSVKTMANTAIVVELDHVAREPR